VRDQWRRRNRAKEGAVYRGVNEEKHSETTVKHKILLFPFTIYC
jgi:hypothetical protein